MLKTIDVCCERDSHEKNEHRRSLITYALQEKNCIKHYGIGDNDRFHSISNFIKQHYIPWYCHVNISTEWYPYASGLGYFPLPLICVIDPADSSDYLNRSTGVQDAGDFYIRLRSHIETGHMLLPAIHLLLVQN